MADGQLRYEIIVDGVPQIVTNIADLDKLIKKLTESFKTATIGTQQFTTAQQQLAGAKQFRTELLSTNIGLQGSTTASSNAAQALLNLNYVVRDSPYFFNNFALGVLAVGNNLNPLIDSFARLRIEAGEKSISTFALLKKALIGGAGISIAFSVVVSAIQAVVFWMSRSKRETDEQTESLKKQKEEVSKLRGEYEGLIKERSLFLKEDISDETLKNLQDQYNTTLKIKDEKQAELDRIKEIDAKYGIISQNQKELTEYVQAENRELSRIYDKISGILFIRRQLEPKEEKITDEYKKQRDHLRDQASAIDDIRRIGEGRGGVRPSRRPFLGTPYATPDPKEFAGGLKEANDKQREFNINLETGKIFANQLGDALSQTFMNGKLIIEDFIKSLIVAIGKMLILRAITMALTGGLGGGATAAGGTPSPVSIFTKSRIAKQFIEVRGKITAEKNQFVANIENAKKQFYTNESFVLIGR